MKAKRLYLLIALVIVALAAAVAAGCNIGERTLNDNINDIGGNTETRVTYFSNGGTFNGTNSIKHIYYAPDNKIYEIKTSEERGDYDPNIYVVNEGYLLDGWYKVKTDENGDIVYIDEELNTVELTDERIVFPYTIKDGEMLYIGAKWTEDSRLEYVLVGDFSITGKEDNVTYNPGDIVKSEQFGRDGTVTVSATASPLECSDATYLQVFSDAECTTPFSGIVRKPADGEDNPKIYVKYIKGLWEIVRTASDVSQMFSYKMALAGTQFYIYPSSGNEIDCSSISPGRNTGNFACVIEGNGVTLKNLKFSKSNIGNGESYSIFGSFTSTAKISNLTLSNVELTYSVKSNQTGVDALYFFCTDYSEETVFDNFRIDGFTMNVTLPESSLVYNLQSYNNWIYGGADTDAEFKEIFTGLTLDNGKLTINNEDIATVTISQENQEDTVNE